MIWYFIATGEPVTPKSVAIFVAYYASLFSLIAILLIWAN